MEENNKTTFVPFLERGDIWKDLKPIPQFTENFEILKISYDKNFQEINDYFRAILHNNEISIRAYHLTTELIVVIIY